MKKAVMFLVSLAAMGLLFTQASAWQGGSQMGYGGSAYTANQAQAGTNGNVAQLRAQISSIQSELSNELAKDNVNRDKLRKLNQQLAQKQQELRSMAAQGGDVYRQPPAMADIWATCVACAAGAVWVECAVSAPAGNSMTQNRFVC